MAWRFIRYEAALTRTSACASVAARASRSVASTARPRARPSPCSAATADARSPSRSRQWIASTSSDAARSRTIAGAIVPPAPSSATRTLDPHAPGRLLEHRPQDALHLLELLGPGDQRGRELDHRVAAVVGPADQPAAIQLRREEAAQQPLRLLAAERLLRVAVPDQLDAGEVAGPAHVADDRDVAQRLQHPLEGGLVLLHVGEQPLALEDVDVGHGHRGGDRVPAERDAVGERDVALH